MSTCTENPTDPQLAGVIDFDAALRDPQNPTVVRADLIGPDNLHPNAAGYAAMAKIVPLSMFRQRCWNR